MPKTSKPVNLQEYNKSLNKKQKKTREAGKICT